MSGVPDGSTQVGFVVDASVASDVHDQRRWIALEQGACHEHTTMAGRGVFLAAHHGHTLRDGDLAQASEAGTEARRGGQLTVEDTTLVVVQFRLRRTPSQLSPEKKVVQSRLGEQKPQR